MVGVHLTKQSFLKFVCSPKDKNRLKIPLKGNDIIRKELKTKIALFFTENKYLQGAIHLVGNASHLVITLFFAKFSPSNEWLPPFVNKMFSVQ